MRLVPKRSSLVAQAVSILREGVRAGLWKDYLPGEISLCERLQISRVTLRAALEQLTREGWFQSAQGRRRKINMGFVERLNTEPSKKVCMLSPLPFQNLPSGAMFWVDALRQHLAGIGYELEIISNQLAFGRQPERALESLVHEMGAAAWVLYLSTPAQQKWFGERAIPCVVGGSCHPGIQLSSVDLDYAATCAHAASTLYMRGCRRIALLMPISQQAGNIESERGFSEFTSKRSDVSGMILHHNGEVRNICLVLDRFHRTASLHDGLIVAKPAHVVTTITHCLRRGIRFPQDVALISRDDDPILESIVPAVARYQRPTSAFASRLCRVVVDLVSSGPQRPHRSKLMPDLVPGETLG